MTATSTTASSLPPVRTACHVPLSLMASISEETISLWLKLGALEKLEQAVLDGYGDQLCGKTSRIPQVNKFLRQVPLFQNKIKEIHRAVSQGKLREVQHLIDRKKLAFCRDQSGATPLHKAVIFGHREIIEYLVGRYGGVIHVRDHQGRTPLHYAAFLPDGGDIYQLLLSAGADERAMDVYGRQPSYYVDGQNESVIRQIREGTNSNGIRKIKPRYYVHTTGNRTLGIITRPVVSKLQIRELISEGNLDSLEELVLQGHGDRLLGETTKDTKVQAFLNLVPVYMERIYDVHRAVMRDQLEHVIILLENRRLAMARDQLGATPLHKAIWFGHYKIAHYISHHFPETLNTLDMDGRTPLHYAAVLRDSKHMYGLLVEAGANKGVFDNKGKTADYYIQYPEHLSLDEVIKRCHKVNANYLANTANRLKAKSPIRQSPLPSNGHSVSPRSDENDGSSKGSGQTGEHSNESDFMLAMLQKDSLAKRLDVNSANIRRWVQERDVEKLEKAVLEGYGEKVVKEQVDVDAESEDYMTCRMAKMVERIQAIHSAVSNDDLSELQTQLDERDYALAKDHMGMTPLHRTVLLGRINILKYLIDKFPETINAKNKDGRTALHYAAAMSRKDGQNLYKILLQAGADPKLRDNHGRTPDYYKTHLMTMPNKVTLKHRPGNSVAARHAEPLNRYSKQGVLERMTAALQRGDVDLLQELVLEGHGRHLLGKTSWNEDVRQFLKSLPSYLASIQSLHTAVTDGDVTAVQKLIGGNEKLLRARDENGFTPVHAAAVQGQKGVLEFLISSFPAALNAKDGLGRTALHVVSQNGNLDLCKLLKDAGADPKILDQKGRTADFYLQNAKQEAQSAKNSGGTEEARRSSGIETQTSQESNRENGEDDAESGGKNNREDEKEDSNETNIGDDAKDGSDSKDADDTSSKDDGIQSDVDDVELGKEAVNEDSETKDLRVDVGSATENNEDDKAASAPDDDGEKDENGEQDENGTSKEEEEDNPSGEDGDEGKEDNEVGGEDAAEDGKNDSKEGEKDKADDNEEKEGNPDDENEEESEEFSKRDAEANPEENTETSPVDAGDEESSADAKDDKNEDGKSEKVEESELDAGENEKSENKDDGSKEDEKDDVANSSVDEPKGEVEGENPDESEASPETNNEVNDSEEKEETPNDESKEDSKDERAEGKDAANEGNDAESKTEDAEKSNVADDVDNSETEPKDETEDAGRTESVRKESIKEQMVADVGRGPTDAGESLETKEGEDEEAKEKNDDKDVDEHDGADNNENDAVKGENPVADEEKEGDEEESKEKEKDVKEETNASEDDKKGDGDEDNEEKDDKENDKEEESSEGKAEVEINKETADADGEIEAKDEDKEKTDGDKEEKEKDETEDIVKDESEGKDEDEEEEKEIEIVEEEEKEEAKNGEASEETNENEIEDNPTTHQTKDHLDELIEHWIKEGDLLRLEHVVLAGQGDRLIERTSDDKQVQDFLDLVPIYMAKIRAVHEAVVKGQLREVRSVLTRKRFALSRDHVGASPLHLAVLHNHADVSTYIISHFPETMDGPDNEGRTPLHYAAALPDDDSLYRLLKNAGADENVEDKSGHSPKYYVSHRGELTLQQLHEPYKTSEEDH